MNDMSQVIIPKSDQISADDLIAGPMTITIASVSIRPGTEQPVSINFEGDAGRPWKPCKSMSKVLVAAWGPDAKVYVGRSVTLYRDPAVKWGGLEVGGIRISHMSDIKAQMMLALTVTKGSRKPFTVKPIGNGKAVAPATPPDEPPPADDRSPPKRDPIMVAYVEATCAALKACKTAPAMFKIIDDIKENRDVLRVDAPELDAQIGAAVKAANERLKPTPPAEDDGS